MIKNDLVILVKGYFR